MKPTDEKRFVQIMLGVADNARDTITPEGMAFRFSALKQFSIEQIEAAALKIVYARKYTKMPPVAEFVEAINGNVSDHIEDAAEVQVSLVLKLMKEHPYFIDVQAIDVMTDKMVIKTIKNTPPVFEDPITQNLMTNRWPFNSWRENILVDEIKWWTKEFKEAYKSFSRESMNPIGQIEACDGIKKLLK